RRTCRRCEESGQRSAMSSGRRGGRATALSRVPGKLGEAADLLEETISRYPQLRERHLTRLMTWRRGVIM
ncbi:hypothetical protein ABZ322_37240, partial [Streptomyces sp. NPDC006129]|uniref:hypothetical protein n=1 Tax=Streptomyces sp. NPDC006129 TaxID=3155348 RepID=UPI0033A1B0E0